MPCAIVARPRERGSAPCHPPEQTMSRKQEFDPQAIPNYAGAGRVGEIDPNEIEEQQSSAQIAQGTDPEIQTDPAAGTAPADPAQAPAETAAASADDPLREDPDDLAAHPRAPIPTAERPRTLRDDRARGETHLHTDNPEPRSRRMGGARTREQDPSTRTPGAGDLDGHVGAP
jgi:hypothetical protein